MANRGYRPELEGLPAAARSDRRLILATVGVGQVGMEEAGVGTGIIEAEDLYDLAGIPSLEEVLLVLRPPRAP